MNFHDAYNWLQFHPAFFKIFEDKETGEFYRCTAFESFEPLIEVVKVNPVTNKIDDIKVLNTATRVWLECGPYCVIEGAESKYVSTSHDWHLDCGGETFEEAIISLQSLVMKKYGDYEKDWEKIPDILPAEIEVRSDFEKK